MRISHESVMTFNPPPPHTQVECEGRVRTEQDKLTECEERLKLQAQVGTYSVPCC